ncbi:MAG: NADH:flavin oxidoreductase, partial [Candidatus Microthrix sp.]|nr:NADH:flavin oxidoreductase [Candidatus Microthrix sp.]
MRSGYGCPATTWCPSLPTTTASGRRSPQRGRSGSTFGADDTGTGIDLTETHRFLDLCEELGIPMVCLTAGSPYYNPHAQRPAYFPPSDGYAPPRDPLIDAAVMVGCHRPADPAHPNVAVIGSGYSYFQQWLGYVAQHQRAPARGHLGGHRPQHVGATHECPADLLAGAELRTRL